MPFGYFEIISTKEKQSMIYSMNKRHFFDFQYNSFVPHSFFATWGEGIQLFVSRASLIYPAFVTIYIVFISVSLKLGRS